MPIDPDTVDIGSLIAGSILNAYQSELILRQLKGLPKLRWFRLAA